MKKLAVVVLLVSAVLVSGCSGGSPASQVTGPTPTTDPTPIVDLGVKAGEILLFTLNPVEANSGGVGGYLNNPVNSGIINVNFLKLTGTVSVTLLSMQGNIIGPQVGEAVQISAPGVATLQVTGSVNFVRVRNLSSVAVTGDARIYYKQ